MAEVKSIIQCKGCERTFETFSGRSQHYKSCTKVEETPKGYEKMKDGKYKCIQCNKTISQNYLPEV